MASLGQESLTDFNLRQSGHLYLFCRSGSPGLRTLGESASETLYSDIDFGYVSEITRKQKEEQIRREIRLFRRNFDDEARFSNALIRLEDGSRLSSMDVDDRAIEQNRLKDELKAKFQLVVTDEEIKMLTYLRRDFSQDENLLDYLRENPWANSPPGWWSFLLPTKSSFRKRMPLREFRT